MAGQTQSPVAPSQTIQQKAVGPPHSSSLAPSLAFGLVVSGERAWQRKGFLCLLGGAGPTVSAQDSPEELGSTPLVSWPTAGRAEEHSRSWLEGEGQGPPAYESESRNGSAAYPFLTPPQPRSYWVCQLRGHRQPGHVCPGDCGIFPPLHPSRPAHLDFPTPKHLPRKEPLWLWRYQTPQAWLVQRLSFRETVFFHVTWAEVG